MEVRKYVTLILIFLSATATVKAQCSGQIMEPGFQFLSSSKGCAPFNFSIRLTYFQSVPGTRYYVDWGDGSPAEVFTQVVAGPNGPDISHIYPNVSQNCFYQVTVDAENGCNPRGSVPLEPIFVTVWTNDEISIDPGTFRVCQGYAASLRFTDNSDWNCFPHPNPVRENSEARWIQWLYGTGSTANMIPGIRVNNVTPGAFPYRDPAPGRNPIYPVNAPGEQSLAIDVPATLPVDIGKEFEVTLKNWNQCNPYDNVLTDGNPFNPVNGNLVNGDNGPQVTTARIVIVDSPAPDFRTRLGNATGPLQSIFCAGDAIYFENMTPAITGANFAYAWQFYDNNTGTGTPLATRSARNPTFTYDSPGQKLIRLRVRDTNAAGNCEAIVEALVTISPSLIAQIRVTDLAGNVITPEFCQENSAPFTISQARFNDASIGVATAETRWRWEFYDESNALVLEAPVGGGFSTTALGPFDRTFITPGIYRVKLRIRDNVTSCETSDEALVRVSRKPVPAFDFNRVCEGTATEFTDRSTLNPAAAEQIVLREWDLDYDGVTFSPDPALDNRTTFTYTFPAPGTHRVALRTTTDLGGCAAIVDHEAVVDPLPNADFLPDKSSGCSVLTVNFTNNAVTGQPVAIKEYRWEIDDGSGFVVDSVQRPGDPGFSNIFTRPFTNYGTTDLVYQVRLRVITVNDCERISATQTITVFPGPSAGFNSLNYSPFNKNCSPVSVSFSVDDQTQSLNPADYRWTISDHAGVISQTSTGTTPSFTYNFVNGTQGLKDFSVTLRTTLASGCFGDSTRVIRVSPVPSSAFVIDTLVYECERMVLNLNALQKGLQQYEWTIISNGVTLLSSVSEGDRFDYEIIRSEAVDQNVEIRLVTTNLANCQSNVTTQQVRVKRTDIINAMFTATPPMQQIPNATVTISNTTTPGPWQYRWDFGDGTTGTSNATTFDHTYKAPGTYTITLTVTNGDCIKTRTVTIQINPTLPELEFEYDPAFGCAPLTVNFTNRSKYADESSYLWQFGMDQGTSRAVNPSYTYYEPGVYTVTLTAANVAGETTQVTKQLIIEVFDRPSAQFNVKPRQIQFPGGKLYTDNQSFGATSYMWHFGDGTTSTDFEPEHVYKIEGNFDVMLIATNAEGCSDTTKLEAGIQTVRSGQLLIPNAFSPNLSGPGNSMGQNDVFLPILYGVTEFQMLVFNRWGQLLFETTDAAHGWDGYYQGRLCQQDVYVYKIIAKYSSGETITRVGDIHLIR